MAGDCKYCGCTEQRPCEGGCAWADDTQTLCSLCSEAGKLACQVVEIFGRLGPMMRPARPDLPAPTWEQLTFDQQQLLVMAHRRIVERDREILIEEMSQDAVDALMALRSILQFLSEHCPEQLSEDEPINDIVIRLLERHVGKKIVLAGQGARM